MKGRCFLKTTVLYAAGLLFQNLVTAQPSDASISSLVRFLGRAPNATEAMGLESGCPDHTQDRRAAIALARQGESAIPAIEKELGFNSNDGSPAMWSDHKVWLLYAYVKISGTGAIQKIRNHAHEVPEPHWDRAMALSLSLTSYISESHSPPALRMFDGRVFFCRPQEPRDALDQLISAWERDDRRSFVGSLGPDAATTLDAMLERRTWSEMRAALWHHKESTLALGYSFKAPGRWSEPEETLNSDEPHQSAPDRTGEFEIDTTFSSASGKECGRRTVSFITTAARDGALLYRVNVLDLDRLLGLLDGCISSQ